MMESHEKSVNQEEKENGPVRDEWTRRGLIGAAAVLGLSGVAGAGGEHDGNEGDLENAIRKHDHSGTHHSATKLGEHAPVDSMIVERLHSKGIPHVDVTSHGAVGDGKTDDTLAIREAMRAVENSDDLDTVYFPNGTYLVDVSEHTSEGFPRDSALRVQADDMRVVFAGGATLKIAPTNDATHAALSIHGRNNVEIVGGTFDGNRDAHNPDRKGGWGHCIRIMGATNVTIQNVTCRNAWGDGIYIAGGREGSHGQVLPSDRLGEPSESVVIRNYHADNNRRQGISVIGARNLWIVNSTLENTGPKGPGAGIDIEPHNDRYWDNINFVNLHTANNDGPGVLIVPTSDSIPGDHRVNVINHIDVGSPAGAMVDGDGIRESNEHITGAITFDGCVWKENQAGFRVNDDWPAHGPRIVLNQCTTVDASSAGFAITPSDSKTPVGNMEFNSPRVTSSTGEANTRFGLRFSPPTSLKDVVVRNPGEMAVKKRAVRVDAEMENVRFIDDRVIDVGLDEFNEFQNVR